MGTVRASGANAGPMGNCCSSGAGAGGSLKIITPLLTGGGILQANGGSTSPRYGRTNHTSGGAGGGGGRILIDANVPFAGSATVEGGMTDFFDTAAHAGRGTLRVVLPSNDAICDSGTWATTCTVSAAKLLGDNLNGLTGAALTITSTGSLTMPGRWQWLSIDLTGAFTHSGTVTANLSLLRAASISVNGTGIITGNIGSPDLVNAPGMLASGNITLASGSLLNADYIGYEGGLSGRNGYEDGLGPGAGQHTISGWWAGGGAHGGDGGRGNSGGGAGGVAYDSPILPLEYGSGGTNSGCAGDIDYSNGGGIVRILSGSTLTLSGSIQARGKNARGTQCLGGAGGAGGSIYARAATLTGVGLLYANGGIGSSLNSTNTGGGGAGGRISLVADGTNTFSGTQNYGGGVTGSYAGGSATAGGAGTTNQDVFPSGVVSQWRFEETSGSVLNDSALGQHHGTLAGTVSYGATGHRSPTFGDRALTFDGSTTYASIPDHADLNAAAFSFETWIYPTTSIAGQYRRIVEKGGNGGGGGGFSMEHNTAVAGAVSFNLWDGAGASAGVPSDGALAINQWHHLVGVANGTNIRLYVDGAIQTGNTAAAYVSTALPITVGKAASGAFGYFTGRISEMTYYNRALTAGEITTAYQRAIGWPMVWTKFDEAVGAPSFANDGWATVPLNCTPTCPTSGQAGQHANAADFAGTNYLSFGAATSPVHMISGSVTVAAWVNFAAIADKKAVSTANGINTPGFKLGIYTSGKPEFEIDMAGLVYDSNRAVVGGTTLTTGTWYFIAGTFSKASGQIRTYVNGVLDRQKDTTVSLNPSPYASSGIGAELIPNAKLDDVMIFDRELTAAEILYIYNNGAPPPAP